MSLNTYVIEGGIGKCVAFTAVIPALVEKSGEPIQVYTPYVDVFAGNPLVKMVYDMGSIPIDDPRIAESDNIFYPEPYKSNFSKGDQHLVESYCELLGVEYDHTMRPKIYTDPLKETVSEWKKKNKIKDKYILLQFSGGQTPIGWAPQNQYVSSNANRNYPPYFVNYIVSHFQKEYPEHTLIDVTLPNEPGYPGVIKCDLHWGAIHELLKDAEGWIGIDSCMNHLSASTGTPGVCLWANTRWTQFGYMHNANVSFHMKEINDYFKADVNDPRNIMVDPLAVVKTFEEFILQKKHSVSVECAHD